MLVSKGKLLRELLQLVSWLNSREKKGHGIINHDHTKYWWKEAIQMWNLWCLLWKKKNFNQHITSAHKGIKPFKCGICNSNFGEKGTLKKHVSRFHEGMKQFKCETCNSNFGEKSNLEQHISSDHEGKK